jgi:MOSC domain
MTQSIAPHILSVCARRGHHFSKTPQLSIRLIAGLGVEGDGHMGERVKHRSRARFDPTLPNLRQVHLIDSGYIALMAARGFTLTPGDIGENIVVAGLDLITLPTGTRLTLGGGIGCGGGAGGGGGGAGAVVVLTGLRNPCIQMERFMPGLMAASLDRWPDGSLKRLTGVMSVVESGGDVRPGDAVSVQLPDAPHQPLVPV